MNSLGQNLKILADIKPLSFDYPSWFVNVKSKPKGGKLLELMARGGMRVGEVLKLTPNEILQVGSLVV